MKRRCWFLDIFAKKTEMIHYKLDFKRRYYEVYEEKKW